MSSMGGEEWATARRMTKARLLLVPAVGKASGVWADLGCGDGVFTYLLCEQLAPGGQLYAVDRDAGAIKQLTHNLATRCPNVTLYPTYADFTGVMPLPPLDGIVMANTLHFVQEKASVLRQLITLLKPGARLIVIEYNTNRSNYAVPHPLDEAAFLRLASAVGLQSAQIVTHAPSSFLGEMYTGLAFAAT